MPRRPTLATAATAAALITIGAGLVGAMPAGAAPSDQQLLCDGHPVTVRVNDDNSGDHGGWSSAQIVSGGEGHLTPLSFSFGLTDDTLGGGVTLFSGTELKGGGHPGSGRTTVTCTQSTTATLADVLDPGEQPPPGVDPTDVVTQQLVVVAFQEP